MGESRRKIVAICDGKEVTRRVQINQTQIKSNQTSLHFQR